MNGWPPAVERWASELRAAAFDGIGANAIPNPTRYIDDLRYHAAADPVDIDDDDGIAELCRLWAVQELTRIGTNGAQAILRDWYKAQHGRVPVPTTAGERRKARAGGLTIRNAAGERERQLGLFELMTFVEIGQILRGELATIVGHQAQAAYLRRLLELQVAAGLPETASPAEAAKQLGTSVDAWIAAA